MNKKNLTGVNIKNLRIAKGLTQEELTAKLNVHGLNVDRTIISKIENQTREVSDFEVYEIANILGVNIEELFDKHEQ